MQSTLALLLGLAACAPQDPAPPRDDAEPLFRTLETGSPADAMVATEKLVKMFDDTLLPRLARVLEGNPRAAARALHLAGDLSSEGSAKLLVEKLPRLLESGDAELARTAVVTAGLRRLRPATEAILAWYGKTDDPAALRALGRIWERELSGPALGRSDEISRLAVLTLVHRLSMSGAATVESCEAMFRVMSRAELEDFLGKHAADRFYSRGLCEQAVRRKGFDPEKGARIHEALLANPDTTLVAEILSTSPHKIREAFVRGFLKDRRSVKDDLLLCDVAATRLSGKKPSTRAEKDALIESLLKQE